MSANMFLRQALITFAVILATNALAKRSPAVASLVMGPISTTGA